MAISVTIPQADNFDLLQIPVEGSATFRSDASYVWGRIPTVLTSMNNSISAMNTVAGEVDTLASQVQTASDNAALSASITLAGANYQGDWSTTPTSPVVYPYPLGVSVSNNGRRWASKVNNNSEEPVAESANWALFPEAGQTLAQSQATALCF